MHAPTESAYHVTGRDKERTTMTFERDPDDVRMPSTSSSHYKVLSASSGGLGGSRFDSRMYTDTQPSQSVLGAHAHAHSHTHRKPEGVMDGYRMSKDVSEYSAWDRSGSNSYSARESERPLSNHNPNAPIRDRRPSWRDTHAHVPSSSWDTHQHAAVHPQQQNQTSVRYGAHAHQSALHPDAHWDGYGHASGGSGSLKP